LPKGFIDEKNEATGADDESDDDLLPTNPSKVEIATHIV
jgi:hypothetical protein